MYWPFQVCIQKILDLGQGGFIMAGTCNKGKNGLYILVYGYVDIHINAHFISW